jgi:transposase-like protein
MSKRKRVIRYSEAFKHEVLKKIEQGEYSINEARRVFGIGSSSTIRYWAKKYDTFGVLSKVIRVEKASEKDRLKALREENSRLKEALADAVLDRKIAESTLEVICDQRGWDVEEIKKKVGTRSQKAQSKRKKK